MLALLFLVGGAACHFPAASYRLNDSKAVSSQYPDVIGFFNENGVDKFGVKLLGQYYTYDCTGEDRKILREGAAVVEYNCTLEHKQLLLLRFVEFHLNARFVSKNESVKVDGRFGLINTYLSLSVNGEKRKFSIETDNGSTRKSFPRAMYRLISPEDASEVLPREIGLFSENDVDSIAVELNNFYYIYTCDGKRHFHYEDQKLMNTYECDRISILNAQLFSMAVELRQPRTEFITAGLTLGDEVALEVNNEIGKYATTTTPTKPPEPIFPAASYRLNDSKPVPSQYPDVIGFFNEDGVDKFGVKLLGQYYTYDCTGQDRKILREGVAVVEYNCARQLKGVFFLDYVKFQLDARFVSKNESVKVDGRFGLNNIYLSLSVNGDKRQFSIETDNGSTRKSFPRAMYRLISPKDASEVLPREIGLFSENDVDSIAVELNNFYYIYTCDGKRHFHYEDQKLINTYECESTPILKAQLFSLDVELRQPRTEFVTAGLTLGDEVAFEVNNEIGKYATTTSPTKPEPDVFPTINLVNTDFYRVQNSANVIELSMFLGIPAIVFYDNHHRTYYILCDGQQHNSYLIQPKENYICIATRNGPNESKFSLKFLRIGNIGDRNFVGRFSWDTKKLLLSNVADEKPVLFENIEKFNDIL